jgi:hypothetical protein
LQIYFLASNNAVEYETLLRGLRITTTLSIHSLLIVNQANKEWSCLDDKMQLYCYEVHKLENNFDSLEYLNILLGINEVANEFPQGIHEPSISKAFAKATKAAESS